MGNRLLRDWTASEAINNISSEAEVLFTRLIMKADDYGSFHSNPKLIRAALFPLKEYKDSQIYKWVGECIAAKLIFVYTAEGKEYLRIINFGQRLRNMRNTFPQPADNSPQLAASSSDQPPEEKRREVEVEVEVEENSKAAPPVGFEIPFVDGSQAQKAWLEWENYQKERKKKIAPSTAKKQIQFLGGRGDPEIAAIINQSITQGWTGLFELKNNNTKYVRPANKRSSDAVIQPGRDFGSFEDLSGN